MVRALMDLKFKFHLCGHPYILSSLQRFIKSCYVCDSLCLFNLYQYLSKPQLNTIGISI